jgi:DeoR family transcriptional regulator, suf operon transcriptional repressor
MVSTEISGRGTMTAVTEPRPALAPPPPITEAQRTVLYALRRRGEATVEQLAESLGITVSAVRQHLAALTDAGLVASTEAPRAPGQRGRPTQLHHLTADADPLFPKAYGELTNQLLGYLDEGSVQQVFIRRRDDRITSGRARLAGKASFAARVRELAAILDEDGYLASFEQVGRDRFVVTEHNCAILSVAREHPHACSSEIEFIRAVLPEATVERTTHMVAGAHSCTYEIRRTSS